MGRKGSRFLNRYIVMIFFQEETPDSLKKWDLNKTQKPIESIGKFKSKVDFHVKCLIEDFERGVDSIFEKESIPKIFGSKKQTRTQFRQEELKRLLSIFNYLFSDKPIKEEPLLLFPEPFLPVLKDDTVYLQSAELTVDKNEIIALRKFYYTHIDRKNALNYSGIIGDPKQIPGDSQELRCKANCIAFSTFFYWLKEQGSLVNIDNSSKKHRITYIQRALFCVFKNEHVTSINKNEIANKYGLKSGQSLYLKYNFYSHRSNRINPEDTPPKNKNKIELFEKVILLLENDTSSQIQAIDELTLLKSKIPDKYS